MQTSNERPHRERERVIGPACVRVTYIYIYKYIHISGSYRWKKHPARGGGEEGRRMDRRRLHPHPFALPLPSNDCGFRMRIRKIGRSHPLFERALADRDEREREGERPDAWSTTRINAESEGG